MEDVAALRSSAGSTTRSNLPKASLRRESGGRPFFIALSRSPRASRLRPRRVAGRRLL